MATLKAAQYVQYHRDNGIIDPVPWGKLSTNAAALSDLAAAGYEAEPVSGWDPFTHLISIPRADCPPEWGVRTYYLAVLAP